MKTFLVLCALVALVYCDTAEYFNEGRCIGIRHKVPDVLKSKTDAWWTSGKVGTYQVCCNEGFPSGTKINGYNANLSADACMQVVQSNFSRLSGRRSGCQFKWAIQPNPIRSNSG